MAKPRSSDISKLLDWVKEQRANAVHANPACAGYVIEAYRRTEEKLEKIIGGYRPPRYTNRSPLGIGILEDTKAIAKGYQIRDYLYDIISRLDPDEEYKLDLKLKLD
jgi:hypothetical protein